MILFKLVLSYLQLYYQQIARIRNGRFLAEILSDITRKKAATPEIGAAVIWLEPKAVYKIKARKAHGFNRGMIGRTLELLWEKFQKTLFFVYIHVFVTTWHLKYDIIDT